MSKLFNKVPGFVKTPPGEERRVLRQLPKVFVVGSLLIALPSLAVRLAPLLGSGEASATLVSTVDFYDIGLLIVHWTAIVTVAIGAFIVVVMKGPAYVADPYPLIDGDAPGKSRPGEQA